MLLRSLSSPKLGLFLTPGKCFGKTIPTTRLVPVHPLPIFGYDGLLTPDDHKPWSQSVSHNTKHRASHGPTPPHSPEKVSLIYETKTTHRDCLARTQQLQYSRCRSVFKKDCYCIHLNFRKSTKFWRYAIAVFFKNASTSRVPVARGPRVGYK